jgi:hypothetical protein
VLYVIVGIIQATSKYINVIILNWGLYLAKYLPYLNIKGLVQTSHDNKHV